MNGRNGLMALLALAAAGAGTGAALASGTSTASGTSVRYAATPTSPGVINPAAVPLGDGYLSTTPKVGDVDSCVTNFPSIGGASADGPWIDARRRTWDYRTKLHVNGAIHWADGSYRVTTNGDTRRIVFNDLPTDHVTGRFPIATTDPAYRYDQNPNRIEAQSFDWKLALDPAPARSPGCLPGGPIGVLDDGVVLFDALDGEGRDAGAHEVLDVCAGHPNPTDTYHHHDVPPCILDTVPDGATRLVGYALDGYGIYVVKNRQGQLPNNVSLDACHGTVSRVRWNGRMTRIFHYVATLEYPYTVGCYEGTAISAGDARGLAGGPGAGPPAGPPPGPAG